MAAIAKGIAKSTIVKAQSGLGVPAAGTGGQELRRVTSVASQKRATYTNNEIVAHQQSTGVTLGSATTDWQFDGLLSPGTYSTLLQAVMRKIFTATAAVTTVSATITTTTITDAAKDFLTAGIKIGDIIRITAGAVNAGTLNANLLATNVTATVITYIPVNGVAITAEGPIASCTITVVGKKALAPLTGHTNTLFTLEEFYSDLVKSELFPDMFIGQVDISLPASGNATIKLASQGLGVRTLGVAQVLTTPTAATIYPVLTAVRGALIVNGASVTNVTGITLTINPVLTPMGSVVGSNYAPDMSRGTSQVTGQFTALFDSHAISTLYASEASINLIAVMAADTTKNSDFVSFSLSAITLTGDTPNDGELGIVRTYPFTAEINAAGGAALANDKTILTIQDSLAA